MAYYKLNTDGTFQSANKQHEGFRPISELERKEDGSYYNYYLPDGSPDLVKEEEELQLEIKTKSISEAKQYLLDTDWVVIKINEVAVGGEDTTALLEKYADILLERENKRLTINQLEA